MDLQIIKTDEEYQQLLNWVDGQFDLGINPESEAGRKLQDVLLQIK